MEPDQLLQRSTCLVFIRMYPFRYLTHAAYSGEKKGKGFFGDTPNPGREASPPASLNGYFFYMKHWASPR